MLNTIKSAYGAGYRAGLATPRVMRVGGKHDTKQIVPPLNPYDSPFAPRYRPMLALLWASGLLEGMIKRSTRKGN